MRYESLSQIVSMCLMLPLWLGSGSLASDSADAALAISDDDSSQERALYQDITIVWLCLLS